MLMLSIEDATPTAALSHNAFSIHHLDKICFLEKFLLFIDYENFKRHQSSVCLTLAYTECKIFNVCEF